VKNTRSERSSAASTLAAALVMPSAPERTYLRPARPVLLASSALSVAYTSIANERRALYR
jgi:hypothetical protein